jgi:hypothetical protein
MTTMKVAVKSLRELWPWKPHELSTSVTKTSTPWKSCCMNCLRKNVQQNAIMNQEKNLSQVTTVHGLHRNPYNVQVIFIKNNCCYLFDYNWWPELWPDTPTTDVVQLTVSSSKICVIKVSRTILSRIHSQVKYYTINKRLIIYNNAILF